MKALRVLVVGAALCGLFNAVNFTFAQGTAFTYQGQLQNNGSLANGSYDLTFSLFNVSSGGSAVAEPLTNSATSISNGLFLVTLDFGGVFNGVNCWLEIGARTNGSGAFTTLSPRQTVTPTPYAIFAEGASNMIGVLPSGGLSGGYSSAVNLNNVANQFIGSFNGSGSGLTGVNAQTLDGVSAGQFWQLTGNGGTTAGANFVGTTDFQPLEMQVNSTRAFRLEPTVNDAANHKDIVNVVGGSPVNLVSPGVYGGTISGGGGRNYMGYIVPNRVTADFGTVGGGLTNTSSGLYGMVGGGAGNLSSGLAATVAGGAGNISSGTGSTVGGGANNTSSGQSATVGGGSGGTSSVLAATVGGGNLNTSSGQYATVAGGDANTSSGIDATVSGGVNNLSQADGATVSGGQYNTSSGIAATVGGGSGNLANVDYATVGGGQVNFSGANSATVGGGDGNVSTNLYTTVGGGYHNRAAGVSAAVGGGGNNWATGDFSVVGAGLANTASGRYGYVGGGSNNTAGVDFSTISGGKANIVGGLLSVYSAIGGGKYNNAIGTASTIGGGILNRAEGWADTVAGGQENFAIGGSSGGDPVDGPLEWTITGACTVGGGYANQATTYAATVSGGGINTASGNASTVCGGDENRATNSYAVACGGRGNLAGGQKSFAAGEWAWATLDGSFVWNSFPAIAPSNDDHRFHVFGANGFDVEYFSQRPDGGGTHWAGIGIIAGQTIGTWTGAFLSDSGVWQNASDRNRKTAFATVNPREVLAKVAALSVQSWRYTNELDVVRHLGPTAQDFKATFGLGTDEKSIGTVDEEGVALAAIQGLNQKVDELKTELNSRDAENGELKQQNDSLARRLNELEATVKQLAAQK